MPVVAGTGATVLLAVDSGPAWRQISRAGAGFPLSEPFGTLYPLGAERRRDGLAQAREDSCVPAHRAAA